MVHIRRIEAVGCVGYTALARLCLSRAASEVSSCIGPARCGGAVFRIMAYKALLVDAGLDDAAESRVRLAAELAGRFGAHLIGVAAGGVMPVVTGPFGDIRVVFEIIEAQVQRVQAALAAAADLFCVAAGTTARTMEWRAFVERPGEALPREARAADLLVIGRGGAAGVYHAAEPGDVLMRAGRPTLVVPPGVAGLQARCVLVAWK